MRRFIIPIAVVAVVIIVAVILNISGIWGGNSGNNYTPSNNSAGNSNNPTISINTAGEGEGIVTNPTEEDVKPTFRIGPGKIFLDDNHIVNGKGAYVAGESREGQLSITNKNDYAAEFSVDYRVPDFVMDGYSRPNSEVRDWVWISDRRPTISAGETIVITIRLGMPEYAEPPGDKWEFWIGVIDQSQTGNLVVEQGQRWLITMG